MNWGLKPLEAELSRVDAIQTKDDVSSLMAHFGRINVTNPIGAYVNQDDKDPMHYLVQSGIGLPDRGYYLLNDPKFRQIRDDNTALVQKMMDLAGDKTSAQDAKAILELKRSLPANTGHASNVDEAPAAWASGFKSRQQPQQEHEGAVPSRPFDESQVYPSA